MWLNKVATLEHGSNLKAKVPLCSKATDKYTEAGYRIVDSPLTLKPRSKSTEPTISIGCRISGLCGDNSSTCGPLHLVEIPPPSLLKSSQV